MVRERKRAHQIEGGSRWMEENFLVVECEKAQWELFHSLVERKNETRIRFGSDGI